MSISETFLVKLIAICLILMILIASDIINPAQSLSSLQHYLTRPQTTSKKDAEPLAPDMNMPSNLNYIWPPKSSGNNCFGAICSMERETQMIYHPGYTVFADNRIGQKWFGDHKGNGLIAKQDIKEGEVIIVEYPMMMLKEDIDSNSTKAMMNAIDRIYEWKSMRDARFNQIWEQMAINSEVFNFFARAPKLHQKEYLSIINSAKFHTNHFGAFSSRKPYAVYGLLSKINFGLPQNIAVVIGDKQEEFVCTIFATKSIKKGEELVSDYFFDWFEFDYEKMDQNDAEYMREVNGREQYGMLFGFRQSEYMELWKKLNSKTESKQEISSAAIRELYPNGIVGKQANGGFEFIDRHGIIKKQRGYDETELAKKIYNILNSGDLYSIIAGMYDKKCPRWLGKMFCKRAKKWRKQRLDKA